MQVSESQQVMQDWVSELNKSHWSGLQNSTSRIGVLQADDDSTWPSDPRLHNKAWPKPEPGSQISARQSCGSSDGFQGGEWWGYSDSRLRVASLALTKAAYGLMETGIEEGDGNEGLVKEEDVEEEDIKEDEEDVEDGVPPPPPNPQDRMACSYSGCPNVAAWQCISIRCKDHCDSKQCVRHDGEYARWIRKQLRHERANRKRGGKAVRDRNMYQAGARLKAKRAQGPYNGSW